MVILFLIFEWKSLTIEIFNLRCLLRDSWIISKLIFMPWSDILPWSYLVQSSHVNFSFIVPFPLGIQFPYQGFVICMSPAPLVVCAVDGLSRSPKLLTFRDGIPGRHQPTSSHHIACRSRSIMTLPNSPHSIDNDFVKCVFASVTWFQDGRLLVANRAWCCFITAFLVRCLFNYLFERLYLTSPS